MDKNGSGFDYQLKKIQAEKTFIKLFKWFYIAAAILLAVCLIWKVNSFGGLIVYIAIIALFVEIIVRAENLKKKIEAMEQSHRKNIAYFHVSLCECGRVPRLITRNTSVKDKTGAVLITEYLVYCVCGKKGDYCSSKSSAAISWNIEQRKPAVLNISKN